ncbi:aspartic peptidase domain-containing protein [Truncatella angustata]|uniref:Aspartic peptidase domain-containing protein n=1 Tax=Truncatella angustata TaxID=152316 RepID=A0A9P8UXS4_9PEZI|nr:aspartic peptidase domain-containing protein [Truncatella angustata]KAH6661329.1 aspartic peptidase domain-containing protein [Truncatella angustata]
MASRLAAISIALASYCHALDSLPTDDITDTPSKYVRFPVIHSTNTDVFSDVWTKRELWSKRGIQTLPLANRSDVAYYAKLEIGSPPQSNYVQLDTGSFELWVNPDCTNLDSSSDKRFCQAVGSYDPSTSGSSVVSTSTKNLRYGIGSAQIQYVTDDIGFEGSDIQLKNVQFGAATSTVDEFSGILGIGHGENVTILYKNFVDELQAQGVTDTKAFSLALGSKSEQEGVIIFGGIDTGKFAGPLVSQPIIPAEQAPDGVPRYWIDMDYLSITPPSGKEQKYANSTMAVFLDSGATLTLLPQVLADTIAADFGATGTDSNGFYLVDCSLNNLGGTVNFAFPGVTIHVPYKEIIRELATSFGTLCYLGITPNEDFVLLGDSMLRSAYAVFDQTGNAIHLAQYVNCGTNEKEISTSLNISSLTGDCDAPDFRTEASASTTASTGLATTTATATSSGNSAASSTGASNAAGPAYGNVFSWVAVWVGAMATVGFIETI